MLSSGIESIGSYALNEQFCTLDRETFEGMPAVMQEHVQLYLDSLRERFPDTAHLPVTHSFIGFPGLSRASGTKNERLRHVDHVCDLIAQGEQLRRHVEDVLAALYVAASERAALAMLSYSWAQAFLLGYEMRGRDLATDELNRLFRLP